MSGKQSKSKKPVKQKKIESMPPKQVGRPRKKETNDKVKLEQLKQQLIEEQIITSPNIEVKVKRLTVPYNPNPCQKEVHDLLSRNSFGVVVVHRGFGKSWLAVNELIKRAWESKAAQGGRFLYVAPEKQQAKNTVWREFKFFLEGIPHTTHESELSITFPNGSVIRLEGADNPDRLRGTHNDYVVMDEVAQMPQEIWYEAIYPTLQAKSGGALFIGTPKGDNLFKEVRDRALGIKNWFVYEKNIMETGVFSAERIVEIMQTLPKDKFEQEYMLSWTAANLGTYYAHILDDPNLGVLQEVKFDPTLPVITGWDLGTSDATVIWFAQQHRTTGKVHFIDFYTNAGKDIYHYIGVVKSKPYVYDYHILPHDVRQVGWETGKNRLSVFKSFGMPIRVAKKLTVEEGIAITQTTLYRSVIDVKSCAEGIKHLRNYQAKVDRITGEIQKTPKADKNDHAADAMRTFAVGIKHSTLEVPIVQDDYGNYKRQEAVTEYDYFNL
ncbi:MAG: hypothetical protein C0446_08280 [Chitinophaga sp.]|nr:hypothetical protein [Chitinophaga sp.]